MNPTLPPTPRPRRSDPSLLRDRVQVGPAPTCTARLSVNRKRGPGSESSPLRETELKPRFCVNLNAWGSCQLAGSESDISDLDLQRLLGEDTRAPASFIARDWDEDVCDQLGWVLIVPP
jgi:hypothetical protein